jgi:quinol monooxygenase YgiN
MTRLGLYTKFTVHPDQRDRFVKILLGGATHMDNVAGCELYIVNETSEHPDIVWVTEVWDSEDQHQASLSLEGVPELIKQSMPLLAGPPEQIRVTPLGGKGLKP